MKRNKILLAIGLLTATLASVPADGCAAASTTVTVTYSDSSGIANANVIATLEDGTILGFCHDWRKAYFCGAISSQKQLSVPDSISDGSTTYAVKQIGYEKCDFDEAATVTSLRLPATIDYIRSLPATVKELHLKNYVSSLYSSDILSGLDRVLVPEETLSSFYDNTSWRSYVLINAEGTEPLKVTIKMTKAGEFAQLLLQQTDNWYKVNELTVVGEMNTDDLNVFKRMKQLTKLDLSQAVITDIPDQFGGATSYDDRRDGFCLLKELALPELNSIGNYAFSQCYRLMTIAMPKVNTVGNGAFAQLGASRIVLPEGLTSIGTYAFFHSKLERISIPSSMTEVYDHCFYYCSRMTSVSLPASVTKIGYEAFSNSGLTSLALPGVSTIGNYAFADCKQLATVTFSEGLHSLGYYSFQNCTALTEIDLPSTLLSMEAPAFDGCYNIKKVISRAVTPPTHNNYGSILNGCDMTDVKLYVPAMSIDNYRAESGWKTFYTILPTEEKTSYAYIYDNATIDDASQFTTDCDLTLSWRNQNRNGSTQYYCGALDYNGSATLSMHNYNQCHYMGRDGYNNPYSYDAHFTSLVSNGTMRSDNVQTKLYVYDTYTWYFISLPYDVKVSDIAYTDGAQFAIRKYSGENRAAQDGSTWVDLTADDVMNAYEGYILRCNKQGALFTFPAINNTKKNNVFEKESVVMPLAEYLSEFEHNRSWNLIGNPYPCYYDTRRMDFTAPITVWNRYNQRYDAYSPVDDSYILHPAQAFFVQRPVDQASITFDKAGRQKDATVQTIEPKAMSQKAKTTAIRKIYNVTLSDGTNEDHTRFVINGGATRAYEMDKDASKFIASDNKGMLVYTVEDGVRYAINERPMADGIVALGFYAPADGEYTLSLNTLQDNNVILIDNDNNSKTAMTGECHFNAAAGYNDARFTLMFEKATGINTIEEGKAQFRVDNGRVSANAPYEVYTLDGRLVGSYDAADAAVLTKGVYVVKGADVKRKIVVK